MVAAAARLRRPADPAYVTPNHIPKTTSPNHPMDTTTLFLAILTTALAGAAFHAWRLGNEKSDVALLSAVSGMLGVGTLATVVF